MWGVTYLFFLPRSCCLYNGHQYCCLYTCLARIQKQKADDGTSGSRKTAVTDEGVMSHQIVSVIPGLVAALTNVWGKRTAAQGWPEYFKAGPDRLPNINKITSSLFRKKESLFRWECQEKRDFAGGSAVKKLPPVQEVWVQSPGLERFPRVGHMATHSRILPGKSYGLSSLAGYRPWGHKKSDVTKQQTLSLSCSLTVLEHSFI